MALTPQQIDALPDYTSAQILKIWRKASVDVATAGVSTAIDGRTLTRADANAITTQIKFWEQRAAQDANPGQGSYALVQFNDPT